MTADIQNWFFLLAFFFFFFVKSRKEVLRCSVTGDAEYIKIGR